ncbi:MAG: YggS family pyridoxal phosphate-dependent enzyme [Oscillospiraceae bacterium]|nr:YggS family pyridoxal phosphate-dependent enzyme [Oscillospiraceae bacterium]
MIDIAYNILKVREAIANAAVSSGRTPGDISLVAASKTKSPELIRAAIAAGVDAVGENRVQEMLEKHAQGAYEGAPLHFIGHLQSNKVRQVVGICDLIESVDSAPLIEMIGKRADSLGITQNILLEVNIGSEPQKSGVLPGQVDDLLALASRTQGISVLGLMSVPPVDDVFERNCNYFDAMFNLFIDIRKKTYDNVFMNFLSMGMSDSYVDAITAGANMVRVGSAIFGTRA